MKSFAYRNIHTRSGMQRLWRVGKKKKREEYPLLVYCAIVRCRIKYYMRFSCLNAFKNYKFSNFIWTHTARDKNKVFVFPHFLSIFILLPHFFFFGVVVLPLVFFYRNILSESLWDLWICRHYFMWRCRWKNSLFTNSTFKLYFCLYVFLFILFSLSLSLFFSTSF